MQHTNLSQEKHGAPFKVVRDLCAPQIYSSLDFWDWLHWRPPLGFGRMALARDTPPPLETRPSLSTRLNEAIGTWGNCSRSLLSAPSSSSSTSTIQQIPKCWPEFGTTPAPVRLAPSFASPWTAGSPLAPGSNAWGSPLCARFALTRFLNLCNIAFTNALKPSKLGRPTLEFGKNGGLRTSLPSLGPSSY
jgi:hypothetical protein